MSGTARVLILPGRDNSGDQHWQTVWEKKYPDLMRVRQHEWSRPHREEWVATLESAINADSTPKILVAHSLAVSLVAHWASRHRGPVVGALLVSPADVERADYPPGTTGFAPIPLQRLPFRTFLVASDDDPRVTTARAAVFAESWGAQLFTPGAFGHMGNAADLGDWAYGAALLAQLRQREAA